MTREAISLCAITSCIVRFANLVPSKVSVFIATTQYLVHDGDYFYVFLLRSIMKLHLFLIPLREL
jgi:hypothetical protein